jgi:hypothetical protein
MRLTSVERALVRGMLDALLPSGANRRLPLGAGEAGVVEFLEEHLDFMPWRTRWGLRAALDLAGAGGLVYPGGARAALAVLAGSRLYPLRELVTLLKSVVCMGYFTNPEVREELGLDLTLAAARARR